MSLDVKDMFSNIPVERTIEIIKNNSLIKVEYKEQLIEILRTRVNQNYFRSNNKYYIQEDGLSVGSPLALVMADIYTNSFEKKLSNRNKT